MPENTTRRVFRFGVFEAEEASSELRKHGVRIKLHAQPFEILTMLLEKPAVVVTREEMRRRLWGDETFVDFDHGLNTAVNKIREALGDSASVPRYVETVAGKGYRFVAPVTLQPASDLSSKNLTAGAENIAANANIAAAETTYVPSTFSKGMIFTTPDELPVIALMRVRTLLVLIQLMYLGFYLGALGNLGEIHDIFLEAGWPNVGALMSLLITTAAVLIPVRLFIIVAVSLHFSYLPSKFGKMFPFLLILDLVWAVSPFLLIHHINAGLALGLSAPLVYAPFAQRSLVLMYSRGQ